MSNQKGTVHHVGQVEVVSDKFSKRLLVVSFKDGNYDKFLAVEFTNDKMGKLDNLQVGHEVDVHYNLESRQWGDKWFTSAKGWKIDSNATQQPQYSQQPQYNPDGGNLGEEQIPF